jgi:phosphoglucosamine mutase
VLDCAFGSAWKVAPRAVKEAGADVIAMNDEPDGARINVNCGSTSLAGLAERVVAEEADLGLAFDGDADRVLAVDERGEVVDGDRIIALSAILLHDTGELKNDVVVATVMANLGFRRALEERGIEVIQAPVGDKFVVEAMAARGAVLGGEQSGHIIFAQHATTGDGILAGLKVAEAVANSDRPLSLLAHVFEPVPQILINVEVGNRAGLESAEALWDEVRRIEDEMGDEGRVLLRPSGTEPLVRVMVEALDEQVARRNAEALAALVGRHLA